MNIAVISFKGGVGKTTSSVHIAAGLHLVAPTMLVDGDAIRSATKWNQRGEGLPFKVASHIQMAKHLRDHEHIVIDTEGNPSDDDLRELAESCDLIIVPAVPESVATDGLTMTLAKLKNLNNERFKVLLTMVPPRPATKGEELRVKLVENNIPVFESEIPRLAVFETAAANGVRACDVKKNKMAGRAWSAYEGVVEEILNG